MPEKQSLGFNLFVDKEDFMLIAAMVVMYETLLDDKNMRLPNKKKVREQFNIFMEKIDRLAHKNGWCSDPLCNWDGEGKKPEVDHDDDEDEYDDDED